MKAEEKGIGIIETSYQLGRFYMNGMGVKRNVAQAVHFFLKAANQGSFLSNEGTPLEKSI